jgi:short-subunit dehydrogenase
MFGRGEGGEQVGQPLFDAGQFLVAGREHAAGDEHLPQVVSGPPPLMAIECIMGGGEPTGGKGRSKELDGGLAVATDVTDREAIRRLVEATLDRYGRIDGLVNNAGVGLYGRLDELDLGEFTRVLALNVVSVVAMTQAVLPAMRAQRSGRIVNISSSTTRMVLPGVGAYAATKSALNMLTSVSRKELEADAIAVSLVLPWITATEFGDGRYQPGQEARPGMVAHSPEYVAQVILRALCTGEERIDIPHGAEQLSSQPCPRAELSDGSPRWAFVADDDRLPGRCPGPCSTLGYAAMVAARGCALPWVEETAGAVGRGAPLG